MYVNWTVLYTVYRRAAALTILDSDPPQINAPPTLKTLASPLWSAGRANIIMQLSCISRFTIVGITGVV